MAMDGSQRTVLSADATQLIQRVAPDPRPAPLDLPHARFGGYERTAVERHVARLESLLANAQQANDDLSHAIGRLQLDNGRLRQRVADLTDQNTRLAHEADNPMETLGRIGQEFVNNAKTQADDIRAKAREQADQLTRDARDKADRLVADAEQQADQAVRQGAARREQAGREADTILAQAREQARAITDDAETKARDAQTAAIRRAAHAEQAAETARRTVAAAYRTLLDAARTLTPGPPVIDAPTPVAAADTEAGE